LVDLVCWVLPGTVTANIPKYLFLFASIPTVPFSQKKKPYCAKQLGLCFCRVGSIVRKKLVLAAWSADRMVEGCRQKYGVLLVKHYKMAFARSVSVRRWVADKIEARELNVDKCRGSLTTCRPTARALSPRRPLRGRGPCSKHCDTCPRQHIRLHIIPLNGPRQQLYTLPIPSSTASYKKG
jgi:hypothetical protein